MEFKKATCNNKHEILKDTFNKYIRKTCLPKTVKHCLEKFKKTKINEQKM